MPTYEAQCLTCDHRQDYIRKIDDRFNTPLCDECGGEMSKAVTTCMVPIMAIAESMHIVSPIDNSIMRNKSDYEKHMKKHGVRPSSEYEGMKAPEPTNNKDAIAAAASDAYDRVFGG